MINSSIANYFGNKGIEENKINELLIEMLEYRAESSDSLVNTRLINELIIKYSVAEKELYKLNQMKNKFIGIAAHDLRSPLAAISGFSELMLLDDELLSEEHKEFVEIIKETSSRMLDLLNDLLDISAIESGSFVLNLNFYSLEEVLKERVHLNSFAACNKSITIIEEYDSLIEIKFDKDKISQAIDNLLTNAIKFSYPDSKITVSLKQLEEHMIVNIKDEGVGIPEDEQKLLFTEVQKLSTKPTAGEKSTGLGLAIVKKIIEAHNGTIEVNSEMGQGSCFTFKLPRHQRRKSNEY